MSKFDISTKSLAELKDMLPTLKKVRDAKLDEVNRLQDEYSKAFKDVLSSIVGKVISKKDFEIDMTSVEYIDIRVLGGVRPSGYRDYHDISLTMRKVRGEDYKWSGKWEIKMNYSTWGDIGVGDVDAIRYLKVIGAMVENLSHINDLVNASSLLKSYNDARHEFVKADTEWQVVDSRIEELERTSKVDVIRAKLVVGAKINTYVKAKNPQPWHIKEIEKVMPKNIVFKGEFYRTRIEDILNYLMSGSYEFV